MARGFQKGAHPKTELRDEIISSAGTETYDLFCWGRDRLILASLYRNVIPQRL
jgi:hypothetical protein